MWLDRRIISPIGHVHIRRRDYWINLYSPHILVLLLGLSSFSPFNIYNPKPPFQEIDKNVITLINIPTNPKIPPITTLELVCRMVLLLDANRN